jgi:hypothetical protein
MSHDDLVHRLRTGAGFTTAEQAEHALTSTLETLGYLLPHPLVRELALALPRSCSGALQTAIGGGDSARRLAHAGAACIPDELPGTLLDEMQVVCGALSSALPLDLIRKLNVVLPPPLNGMFARFAAPAAHGGATGPAEQGSAEGLSKVSSHDGLGLSPHAREVADK